jgi:GPH family glycoside/pentoside/hexuronide:cation symporter
MYAMAQLEVFTDTIQGIRVVALGTGLAFVIAAAIPALFLKERVQQTDHQPKLSFWFSFRSACTNRSFLLLIAINVLVIVSSQMVTHLGLYLKIFYVFEGDTKGGAIIAGIASTAYQISAVATIPIVTWLAHRIGKKRAVVACLGCMLLGTVVKWIAYAPGMSHLIPLAAILVAPGNSAILTTVFSMVGDVIDHDEKQTGRRREGMYVAVYSWVTKLGFSVAALVSGAILVLSGFRQELGGAQPPETFLIMRILFVTVPLISISLAVLVLRRGSIKEPLPASPAH